MASSIMKSFFLVIFSTRPGVWLILSRTSKSLTPIMVGFSAWGATGSIMPGVMGNSFMSSAIMGSISGAAAAGLEGKE